MPFRSSKTPRERFDEKFEVASDGCWNWLTPSRPTEKRPARANTFWLDGRPVSAHRAAWLIYRGPIPDGLIIRHTCDNGLCVNSAHMLLGTYADNTADMFARGRHHDTRGERSGTAKLTNADILRIRALHAAGERGIGLRLAAEYGVAKSAISRIVNGKRWRHL
jgi:hypothetical protein